MGRKGEVKYRPTTEENQRGKNRTLCLCCGTVIDYEPSTDDVTGKPVCSRCARILPGIRSGEINPYEKRHTRDWPPGYRDLVMLFLRYEGKIPDGDTNWHRR